VSEPFMGEIRPFAFDFAPKGWAMCIGQLLAINQNQALFSILGNTYGGNGQTTFALPDLRGRSPLHWDGMNGQFPLGSRQGAESITFTVANLPPHNHLMMASPAQADSVSPQGGLLASPAGHNIYGNTANTTINTAVGAAGNGQPVSKLQPYLVINYCIALVGIFPSRT